MSVVEERFILNQIKTKGSPKTRNQTCSVNKPTVTLTLIDRQRNQTTTTTAKSDLIMSNSVKGLFTSEIICETGISSSIIQQTNKAYF